MPARLHGRHSRSRVKISRCLESRIDPGSFGPNRNTVGVPHAAAAWESPESIPTATLHTADSAMDSATELPTELKTSPFAIAAISFARAASAALP